MAREPTGCAYIVCNNTDYVAKFDFDSEWDAYTVKTARFIWNGQYRDIVFSGSECAIPAVDDASAVGVGVFAGELRTTTPAMIMCFRSVLDGDGTPAPPSEDVYAQIMALLNDIETYKLTPVEKTDEMTQEVGRDAEGKLYTRPGSGSGGTSDHRELDHLDAPDQHPITAVTGLRTELDSIEAKIPAQASPQNQLADKNFVNSTVGTNTAYYISNNGEPFTSFAQLLAYSGAITNNDYAFVIGTDSAGNTIYTRYKYNSNTQQWAEEYVLNNSSFTSAQWAAISSDITALLVQSYNEHVANENIHVTTDEKEKWNGKLSEPSSGMEAGKYFRIASIDADGHAVLEAVDAPACAMKIKIDGLAQNPDADGYVDIGRISAANLGVAKVNANYGSSANTSGDIVVVKASDEQVTARSQQYCPIVPYNLDYAVKAAMCDGVGAAWTAAEQQAAQERLGILSVEGVLF